MTAKHTKFLLATLTALLAAAICCLTVSAAPFTAEPSDPAATGSLPSSDSLSVPAGSSDPTDPADPLDSSSAAASSEAVSSSEAESSKSPDTSDAGVTALIIVALSAIAVTVTFIRKRS